jgi:hypothetical protein
MIQTLNLKLLDGMYAENQWECSIEIPTDFSLEELHLTIQDVLEFDNDHMYGFVIAKNPYARKSIRYDCDDDAIFQTTIEKVLEEAKGQKMFYIFDYGDNWMFHIAKSRKKPAQPSQDVNYPRIVSENGIKPIQYPDWEE